MSFVSFQNEKSNKNFNDNNMYFMDLQINKEFDETISFTHYFSVFRQFEIKKRNKIEDEAIYPLLITKEYFSPFFEDIKPMIEPAKESEQSIIGRIKQFSRSTDDKFKKNFIRNLKPSAEIIGIDKTCFLLIPALAKIIDESLQIKDLFLEKLNEFVDYLHINGEQGYNAIKNNILNILEEFYNPKIYNEFDDEGKQLINSNFLKICTKLTQKDRSTKILRIILSFANNENKDELIRIQQKKLSIYLINKLFNEFEKEYTENYLLPQLFSFSDDDYYQIRESVVSNIPDLCEIISLDMISTKVYTIIKKLVNDSKPSVRMVCVEAMPKIIKISKEKALYNKTQCNNKIFVELIEKLIIDNDKLVRNKVLEKLGEIIAPLDKDELSPKLFDFYVNSIDEYYFNKSNVTLIKSINAADIYCYAYNFPAILFCYGSTTWNRLKKIFLNLVEEKEEKIRRSIICSFHEVSSILGEQLTENELLPIYNKFLDSSNKTEKNLALRNLPKILKNVSKDTKKKYFKYFEVMLIFQKKSDSKINDFRFINWKNKLDVVESMLCYYYLYDNDVIYNSIIPQCINFCFDDFAKVRNTSAKVLGQLVQYLYINNYNKDKLIQLINVFAYNKKYQSRICFVKMCKNLMMCFPLYKEHILPILKDICKDKINNVKVAMSKLIVKLVNNRNCPCFNDQNLLIIGKHLKKYNIKSIENILCEVNFEDIENKELNEIEDSDISSKFINDYSFLNSEFNITISKKKNNI